MQVKDGRHRATRALLSGSVRATCSAAQESGLVQSAAIATWWWRCGRWLMRTCRLSLQARSTCRPWSSVSLSRIVLESSCPCIHSSAVAMVNLLVEPGLALLFEGPLLTSVTLSLGVAWLLRTESWSASIRCSSVMPSGI